MESLFRAVESLQGRLQDGIVVECGGDDAAGELFPEELVATNGWAPHRRLQFSIGRTLARRAVRRVGYEPAALLFGAKGEPLWPPGVVGSISHKRQCCIVIVASSARLRGVGVDLERDERGSEESSLVRRVCSSEREQVQLATLAATTPSPGTLFLAAKEAFFKFQFPITRAPLDWDDVEVSFTPPELFTALGRIGAAEIRAEGTYLIADGWILAAVLENQAFSAG